jgi:excinuclease ABC subunit B
VAFNLANGITPRGVVKAIRDLIDGVYSEKSDKESMRLELEQARMEDLSEKDVAKEIKRLEKQMMEFARNLEFEAAASARDQLNRLRALTFGAAPKDSLAL